MNATMRNLMFWSVSSRIEKNERHLSFSDFVARVEAGHVGRVTIVGGDITGYFKSGQAFRARNIAAND